MTPQGYRAVRAWAAARRRELKRTTRAAEPKVREGKNAMTRREHRLMLVMFTTQHHLYSTLVDVLKSRDLLTDDDLEAFDAVNLEVSMTGSAQKIGDLYRAIARKVGVPFQ